MPANLLIYVSLFLVLVTFIPQGKSRWWAFNIWDYIRPQICAVSVVWVILIFSSSIELTSKFFLSTFLGISIGFHLKKIWPYLPLAPKEMFNATDSKNEIRLMISNVYQFNNQYHKLAFAVKHHQPDVLLLVETNQTWLDGIKTATDVFPYNCEVPLENTYGMALYSKYELLDSEIRYQVSEEIPSIKTRIKFPFGKVAFYGIHPYPPVPQESKTTLYKDKELIMLAAELKNTNESTIVCGDLNDVAWSNTTSMFQQITGLLDPRKGRRFLATFHVKFPLLRFPLDHIFCSQDFTLISLEKLPSIDSDHYPVMVRLNHQAAAEMKHTAPELEEETIEESKEILQEKLPN